MFKKLKEFLFPEEQIMRDVFHCGNCNMRSRGQWCLVCTDKHSKGTYWDERGYPWKPTARIRPTISGPRPRGGSSVDKKQTPNIKGLEVNVEVDSKQMDVAITKAEKLVELLEQANQLSGDSARPKLYSKEVKSKGDLREVMTALDILDKCYTITKSKQQGNIMKNIPYEVWRVEEISEEYATTALTETAEE
ncbi:hypothetical protein DFQ00_101446 [Paenibacillus barcinonensis]|uniref:Uncharacterized protein n=1 Tax=Paenibacillus barcinonensis TaxID=198119 RepID=A0A2V4WJH1_PAEBA|nr:hypothetical protein DFQ00_101446 [Paenibacillus barcinonensis]